MKQKSMLIVDDMELNRAILCDLFQDFKHYEAADGQEALELLEAHGDELSVILMDVVMPRMDGIAMLQQMRLTRWIDRVPVILITAVSNENTALEGYTIGASDIISKPFHPNVVRRRVENIVELYDHKRNMEQVLEQQYVMLAEQAEKLKRTNHFVVDTLSTVVEFRNGESGSHIRRIREITRTLLEALSRRYSEYAFSSDTIEVIADAAALHDIGKIAIPDSVLLKPGKLTPEEFEVMKTHTIRGCEVLNTLDYVQDKEYYSYCYEICRHHHERWDGSGYPDGLKGNEIPIWAQVVSLADVYEALTSERVYKPAYTHQQAMGMILHGECGVFNPQLLRCFVSVADLLSQEAELIPPAEQHLVHLGMEPHDERQEAVTERTLRLVEQEREKYRVLSELAEEITFEYDISEDIAQFSERYNEVFDGNYRQENMSGCLTGSNNICEEDRKILLEVLSRLTPENNQEKLELRIRTMAGQYEWFSVAMSAVWEGEPLVCKRIIGRLTNIDCAKKENDELKLQARLDPLTGLYNRRTLEERIAEMLQSDTLKTGALIFVDIDNFKAINDTFGHPFGDDVLRQMGKRLRSLFRDTDAVGRIGGDEFLCFLQNIHRREDLNHKAGQICTAFRTFLRLGSSEVEGDISGSVGIALYPADGSTFEQLLDRADRALYFSKNSGKDRYAYYSEEMGDSKFASVLSKMDNRGDTAVHLS